MSLPRSHSHNRPTNPRNKPQHKVTRKCNSRSKGLKQSAQPVADCPRGGGGLSVVTGLTVRKHRADRPKNPPKLPVLHLEKQTVRALPADCPRGKDRPLTSRTVRQTSSNQKCRTKQIKTHKEHTKNTTNNRPAGSSRTVHVPQADCPPGTGTTARTRKREVNLSYPSTDLPNGLSSWGKIWGRYEASLGDTIPQNLSPQTN
jgi:hypothetical protein